MRILLVEDERSAARMTLKGLREHGHAVDIVGDGAAAVRQAAATVYDLVILDVLLPVNERRGRVPGAARNNGNAVPVLMLTARDAVDDRIAGLDAGADDYLTKPFHFGELLARVRAMTRRRLPLLPERLECGRLVLNTRTQEARVDDRLVELTAREYALLEYLCRQQGGVVSREEIAERVWDGRYDPCSNVIDVYVQRLRRKLDTGKDSFIRTRRGAGYQLVARRGVVTWSGSIRTQIDGLEQRHHGAGPDRIWRGSACGCMRAGVMPQFDADLANLGAVTSRVLREELG